ncbi:mandelate racemase/muconate lactonizing enzyme family protein [Polynucleobacter difficilis]|uniref:mandelate racemase/muconate lactonizing enzyme family protein n=1 Tax=Polynucleobacter difficilis TaxID=556054 RepID=UPI000D34F77E|nr:enolase C-terminal domain-like protein [Polynucleobacter difficilis]
MNIKSATLFPLSIPLRAPMKMSGETVTHANTLLLRLIDGEGREGWGETSAAPLMTGETLGSVLANTAYLLNAVKEVSWEDPCAIGAIQSRFLYANSSAKSCVELALLDLFAQAKGESAWSLLRKAYRIESLAKPDSLPVLRMLGGSLETEIADARALRDQGYRHWKIKVGVYDLNSDLQRVAAICAALEGDTISADANGAFTLEQAIAFCRSDLASHLSFVEQPIAADHSIADFVSLKTASPLPICLDESIHGIDTIQVCAEKGVMDGASLKLIKLGGMLPGMRAAIELEKRGLNLNLACKVAETSLSAAATASIGFAMNGAPWGLSMSNAYLEYDICDAPLIAAEGRLNVEQLNSVGIGVVPNLALVKKTVSSEWGIIEC